MNNFQKAMLGIPLRPEIGKQNIKAEEVYWWDFCSMALKRKSRKF